MTPPPQQTPISRPEKDIPTSNLNEEDNIKTQKKNQKRNQAMRGMH